MIQSLDKILSEPNLDDKGLDTLCRNLMDCAGQIEDEGIDLLLPYCTRIEKFVCDDRFSKRIQKLVQTTSDYVKSVTDKKESEMGETITC